MISVFLLDDHEVVRRRTQAAVFAARLGDESTEARGPN